MPVAPASTPDLIDLIRKSGIASAAFDSDALPPEPQKAAGVLVQKGVITRFQAQQLLLGRHKGFRLGAYVILEQLGRGGMGVVYLAEHQELRRKVAIKVLVVGKEEDAKLAAERFFREARAAAALDHPNIVRLFDVCRHGDTPYLVMEYVEGETLQQAIDRDGGLPYTAAADAVAQAAAGLQHAHEKGFVHRDIKPGNLMRDKTGVVKILDMGLARSSTTEDKLTERLDAGAVVGTADFIAPEQALNSPNVDIRADIYSLGASFFALATGKPPFAGNTTQKLLQHQMAAAPSLSAIDATLPKGLAGVVAKMLAKKPQERFQTPAEVIAALAPWLGNTSRVLAGLSRTNLAAGADLHAKLHERAGNTGRFRRPSEDEVSDSGVVDPADPAAETGAVASAQTARSEKPKVAKPAAPKADSRKPLQLVAGLAVAVGMVGAGIAFALGAFDSTPAREQVQNPSAAPPADPGKGEVPSAPPAPPHKKDPPKTNTTPAPITPVPERVLAGFDLSGRKAFAVRYTVEIQLNGQKRSTQLSRTGAGEPPNGWSARCYNKDTQMEFFADDANGVGIRNVTGPGSAMLFTPKIGFPNGACRVRIDYSAPVRTGGFIVRFKPDDPRPAWDAGRPPLTAPGVWRSYEFVADLKGAKGGLFEFHNTDANPEVAVRIRSAVFTEPPADTAPTPIPPSGSGATAPPQPAFPGWTEGPLVYRLDAASVPAFRVSKEGSNRTAGEAEELPRGVLARCWKAGATGEFRRDEADGSPALGLTNLSDARSGQFTFELERDMGVSLKTGSVYQAKLSYLTRNEATGSLVVQTTEYKHVASAKLEGPPAGWKTATATFERRDGAPVRVTVDNGSVGEGNTVYFRRIEVVEMLPPKQEVAQWALVSDEPGDVPGL
ncbi:protein kinase, partial [bacterium]|nr:protein kinase [bacterium]